MGAILIQAFQVHLIFVLFLHKIMLYNVKHPHLAANMQQTGARNMSEFNFDSWKKAQSIAQEYLSITVVNEEVLKQHKSLMLNFRNREPWGRGERRRKNPSELDILYGT